MECLEFMKDVFIIALLLMQKQYYQILFHLIIKSYSSNYVLLRLDYILHYLLDAKLHV